jgi:hypothetical protein
MKKAYTLIKDLLFLGLFLFVIWNNVNSQESIENIRNTQDSVSSRMKYVIDFHFDSCDFTPKKEHVPYYPGEN